MVRGRFYRHTLIVTVAPSVVLQKQIYQDLERVLQENTVACQSSAATDFVQNFYPQDFACQRLEGALREKIGLVPPKFASVLTNIRGIFREAVAHRDSSVPAPTFTNNVNNPPQVKNINVSLTSQTLNTNNTTENKQSDQAPVELTATRPTGSESPRI